MTFPGTPLIVTVRAAFGADVRTAPSTWDMTDLTDRWDRALPIVCSDGRSEGATQAETSQLTITLTNNDGWLTPYDARSPWWPYVAEGTPFEVLLNAGAGDYDLFQGYLTDVTPRWPGRNRHLCVADIVAHGITQRLGRGKSPLNSALWREMTRAQPVHWWPLDDGKDATAAASGVPAGTPLTATASPAGTPAFAAVDGPAGAPLPHVQLVADAAYLGTLSTTLTGLDATGWTVEGWVYQQVTDMTVGAEATVLRWSVDGTYADQGWRVTALYDQVAGTSTIFAIANTSTGSPEVTFSRAGLTPNAWHHFRLSCAQVGADITIALYVDDVLGDDGAEAGWTIGRPLWMQAGALAAGVIVVPATNVAVISLADLAWHNTATPDSNGYQAGIGWAGESASDRIERLCTEEGVPVEIVAGDSEPMGPQAQITLVEQLQEAENTDLGRLTEAGFGFRYRPRSSLYNQAFALTIDASNGELQDPFTPKTDSQKRVNEVKVSRRNGSSATWRDETHQQTHGKVDRQADVNTETDDVLLSHAQARVAIGTVEAARYPDIATWLHRCPQLLANWQALTLGDRIRVVGLDNLQHPRQQVDQIVEGRTQTITGRRSWMVSMRSAPARPFTVAVVEGSFEEALRADTDPDGSTLTQEYPATATSLQVATTSGLPLLSTSAADYPVDVDIAGVRIRATAVSGASSPQTMTVVRGLDGWDKTLPAGSSVRLWQPAGIAL